MSCPHISRAVKVDGEVGKQGKQRGRGRGQGVRAGVGRCVGTGGNRQSHTHRVLEFHLY